MNIHRGSCLCGAVQFETRGDLRPSIACHCSQCRKTSGHYWSATQVPDENLTIFETSALTWFQSSPAARRGFCNTCGASLFWRKEGEGATSIGSGTFDGPTGIKTAIHIFCADQGDYYEIPQSEL